MVIGILRHFILLLRSHLRQISRRLRIILLKVVRQTQVVIILPPRRLRLPHHNRQIGNGPRIRLLSKIRIAQHPRQIGTHHPLGLRHQRRTVLNRPIVILLHVINLRNVIRHHILKTPLILQTLKGPQSRLMFPLLILNVCIIVVRRRPVLTRNLLRVCQQTRSRRIVVLHKISIARLVIVTKTNLSVQLHRLYPFKPTQSLARTVAVLIQFTQAKTRVRQMHTLRKLLQIALQQKSSIPVLQFSSRHPLIKSRIRAQSTQTLRHLRPHPVKQGTRLTIIAPLVLPHPLLIQTLRLILFQTLLTLQSSLAKGSKKQCRYKNSFSHNPHKFEHQNYQK